MAGLWIFQIHRSTLSGGGALHLIMLALATSLKPLSKQLTKCRMTALEGHFEAVQTCFQKQTSLEIAG